MGYPAGGHGSIRRELRAFQEKSSRHPCPVGGGFCSGTAILVQRRNRDNLMTRPSWMNDDRDLAWLNREPALNPSGLLMLTRCRVLRPFYVAGKRVEPSQVIDLAAHDASSMAALKRVEILSS